MLYAQYQDGEIAGADEGEEPTARGLLDILEVDENDGSIFVGAIF